MQGLSILQVSLFRHEEEYRDSSLLRRIEVMHIAD